MAGEPGAGLGAAAGDPRVVSSPPRVAVCVVTHQSAADLPGCLEAVAALRHRPLEVVVVDCASADGSAELAGRLTAAGSGLLPAAVGGRVVALPENRGFAGGMNRALAATDAPFVLTLNPDARPAPDYLERLLPAFDGEAGERVAAATGRLTRPAEGEVRRLDACGMRLTLTWRHLDRGSGEPDRGQFPAPERVFGATGAASLFRRRALDDAAVDGEIFASEFHSFREDAELCFRLRERGWEILYLPAAACEHRRSNLPERRAAMPAAVNFHSLKNRYLLRAYHQDALNLALTLGPALLRDLGALGYVLLRERSSLAAYAWLWRRRAAIRRRRRTLRARRLAGSWTINRWFLRRGLPW